MKKLLLFISLALSIGTSKAQYAWHDLPNAPKTYRLDDMYFLTPKMGWAISPDYNYLTPNRASGIYRTKDGGNSWETMIDSVETFYRSITFLDSLTGFVGNLGAGAGVTADTNFMYKTTDGGYNWTAVTNVPGVKPVGMCGMFRVNDSTMYACGTYYGPPSILKTTNKGKTWTNIDISPYAHGLVDMHFTSVDSGFVVGSSNGTENALVLHTTDGGATWTQSFRSNKPSTITWKIVFPTKNTGYASIQRLVTQGTNYFLKTTDAGTTWTMLPFPDAGYNEEGIGFINDSTGWIGGDNAQVYSYKTLNGGSTWKLDHSFGKAISPYTNYGPGAAMNRFRQFGDTLMYASGNTVYKYQKTNITGIDEINEDEQLSSFAPNPFSDYTIVNLPLHINKFSVNLYNILGVKVRTMLSNTDTQLYIYKEELLAGIYFLEISDSKGLSKKGKLIIE